MSEEQIEIGSETTEDDTEAGKQVLRKEKRELPVPLTADERRQMARRLADLEAEIAAADEDIDDLKSKHKDEMAVAKETAKGLRKERAGTAKGYREGTRRAEVAVEIIADYNTGTICPFRTDTGEPVLTERRLMTDKERQMQLAGTEPTGGEGDETPAADPDADEMFGAGEDDDDVTQRLLLCDTESAAIALVQEITDEHDITDVRAWVQAQRPTWSQVREELKAQEKAIITGMNALSKATDPPDAENVEGDQPAPGDDEWLGDDEDGLDG